MDKGNDWILLQEFLNSADADVIRSLLLSCGIEAKVFGVNDNQIWPHLTTAMPLRLMVRKSDMEAAKGILASEVVPVPGDGEKRPQKDVKDPTESLIEKAYRAAIYGAVLLPVVMQLYSLILLRRAYKSAADLDRPVKNRIALIAALDLGILVFWTCGIYWVSRKSATR